MTNQIPHYKSSEATHRLVPSNLFGAWDVVDAETGEVIGTMRECGYQLWEVLETGRIYTDDVKAFREIIEAH